VKSLPLKASFAGMKTWKTMVQELILHCPDAVQAKCHGKCRSGGTRYLLTLLRFSCQLPRQVAPADPSSHPLF
jgi:hypothetical protein